MAGYQGQGVSIDPSVVQNIPCRRKEPEGLHLNGGCMESLCIWKMMKTAETKRREKQRIFACDGWIQS